MAKTETERHELYNGSVVVDFYPKSHRYKLISEDGVKVGAWLKSPSSIVDKLDKSGQLMSWAVNCFEERMIEEMRDGVQFTRDDVTSMLAVSKNAHTEKKKASANVGTVVHYYAQHHAKISSIEDAEGFEDLDEPDQEKARNGADAFDKWYEELGCEFVQSEFLIYSKKQRFVGRVDELIKTKNGLELIDYKTSKGVYTTQVYQVTSYLKAKEEEEGIRIAGARLVHLIKDDIYDKDGNLIKKAGSFDEVYLSRKDLVDAYVVFKALKTVAERDPIIKKIIDKQKHERK